MGKWKAGNGIVCEDGAAWIFGWSSQISAVIS